MLVRISIPIMYLCRSLRRRSVRGGVEGGGVIDGVFPARFRGGGVVDEVPWIRGGVVDRPDFEGRGSLTSFKSSVTKKFFSTFFK